MGTTSLQCRLSPSRSKNSSGAMRTVTMRSPAGAPCMPASPKPWMRSCWPSRMPLGISTETRWRSGTRPWPSHSGHGLSMTVPVPWQAGHVVADCMSPKKVCCTVTTRPGAVTFLAGHFLAVLAQARAVAIGARRQAVVNDLLLLAGRRLFQRDADAHAHVAAVLAHLASACGRAAEEGGEDVAHAAEAATEQVLEIDADAAVGAAAARRAGNRAKAVVLGLLLGVGQHVVGLVQLLELVFGIRCLVHVRVQLPRPVAKCFLDLGFGGVAGDAEDFVEVLSCGHDR